MLEIGIVGYGIVGKATHKILGEGNNISILDPEKGYKNDITHCDIIFICINEKDQSMENLISLIDILASQNKKCLFVISFLYK